MSMSASRASSRASCSMLVQLELMKHCPPHDLELEDIVTVKTEFGHELTGRVVKILASESNPVQQLQAEPSSNKITREALSINSQSVRNGSVYQPILGTDNTNNCGQPLPQKQQMEAYQDSSNTNIVNSQPCSDDCDQPEENDMHCISRNQNSVHTKGDEQMCVLGPVHCEGLSGAIDDYSDGVDEIHYCIPPPPQPILVELSPLVLEDVDMQTSIHTNTSAPYEVCHSEAAAATSPIHYYIPPSPRPILVEVSPLVIEDVDMPLSFHSNTSDSSGPYVACHSEVATAASMVLVVTNKDQVS